MPAARPTGAGGIRGTPRPGPHAGGSSRTADASACPTAYADPSAIVRVAARPASMHQARRPSPTRSFAWLCRRRQAGIGGGRRGMPPSGARSSQANSGDSGCASWHRRTWPHRPGATTGQRPGCSWHRRSPGTGGCGVVGTARRGPGLARPPFPRVVDCAVCAGDGSHAVGGMAAARGRKGGGDDDRTRAVDHGRAAMSLPFRPGGSVVRGNKTLNWVLKP